MSRLVVVCALVSLQLAPASGHVLHHALDDGASAESHACGECACEAAASCVVPCSDSPDTSLPTQHDCDDCFLCGVPDVQIVRVTSPHRLIPAVETACPLGQVSSSSEQLGFLPRGVATPFLPLPPAHLCAVTLPLLD